MKSKKFTILAAAIMVFIFWQSALNADLSSAESGVVVEWIMRTFEGIFRIGRETLVVIVRKGAHFTEYMILGCSLAAAVREWMPDGAGERCAGPVGSPGGEVPAVTDGNPCGEVPAETGEYNIEQTKTHGGKKLILPAWVIGTLYAVSDEVHQYFVPGRSCELRDMAIDSCGVFAGVMLVQLVRRLRR